jgi:SAM-dependent methyltransferase
MRFFEPTERFLDWLAGHAGGRVVFDVGCGEGHVLLALHARRVKAVGIDPRYEAEQVRPPLSSCVLPMRAEECGYLKRAEAALVLFCRPCHSGFVALTIPMLRPSCEVLYVGCPFNAARDLPGLEFEEVAGAPPCPEEKVYRVRPPRAARRTA